MGNTITFILTPNSTEQGAIVNGMYNSQSLFWSSADAGDTYTTTYTVSLGDADQNTPLQITGVTITDNAGNISSQGNGTDILKFIDATPPKFSLAVLNEETGIFTITFNDAINASAINPTGLSIRDNTGTVTVTLSIPELTIVNATTISFNMTQAKLVSVIAFTTSVLDIDVGAVQDIIGNTITLSANNVIITIFDTTAPSFP